MAEPGDHLFRREAGRMVAALTRLFGVHNLALAEDVVQDAFVRAIEVWKLHGVPENPSAWLMATAKHRALDILRRERTARTYAPELGLRLRLESEWTLAPTVAEAFGETAIRGDQLRMMFSCCHPQLPEIAQVALMLNILCGFGVSEVAAAFLTKTPAMEKRIARGKKVLAGSNRLFDLSDDRDVSDRLSAVQRALYLLFNEGYHGAHAQSAVRAELCVEAMRLAELLLAHPDAATPESHALVALMCFNAARLPARVDAAGNLSSLYEQDRGRWDPALIAKGEFLLDHSATGSSISEYHLEAAIAALHAAAHSLQETNWPMIVTLYDTLLALRPSPVVALNRAIAVSQRDGAERGLAEIEAIEDVDRLVEYPFYFAALGELELRLGRGDAAREHYASAGARARNAMERRFFERRALEIRGQD